jgi:hypothetical protein
MSQRSQQVLLRAAAWVLCALCASCDAIDSARLTPFPISTGDSGVAPDDGGADSGLYPPDSGPPSNQRDCNGIDLLDVCMRENAVTACVDGICRLVQCVEGFVDCDGMTDNGCEATLDSTEHCGFCNAPCVLANAATRCNQGSCELEECLPLFGDCDESPSNGCETSLSTLQSCGGCGSACGTIDNGAPECLEGDCGVGTCIGAFGDCDENPENGCEQPLVGDDHCGGCNETCEPANATGICDSGSCIVDDCEDGHYNCNGLPADGCEATLDSPDNCGLCGVKCSLPHAEALACSTGAVPSCMVDHGCPAGATGCEDGALENGCEDGFADCNGVASDGCEARLDTLVNCGACAAPCSIANAITSCDDGACVQTGCEPGYGQCTTGGPCVSLANDEDNCGECGTECGIGENCYGGECTDATCTADRADCDGNGTCETVLTSTSACGLCGLSCGRFDDATAACTDGRCTIGQCDPGFRDCDGQTHNGCEINERTLDTCGSCTMGCTIAGATESCSSGTCTFTGCEPGRANCNESGANLADGCETNITLPQNCGACGRVCEDLPNVLSGGCAEMRCQIICRPGFADCDQNPNNGCEAELGTAASCGGCGVDCTDLPNVVSASCGEKGCEDLVCAPGFSDCDGLTSNGCERSIRTLTDCGSCNTPCAPARATASCSTGMCTITTCSPGFANCDSQAANGCEASLGDPATCGSCNIACDEGWACTSGQCKCTSNDQCDEGLECCNGECISTSGVCSWWPCPVASTNRPTVNCDACNNDCRFVGAQWCCGLD